MFPTFKTDTSAPGNHLIRTMSLSPHLEAECAANGIEWAPLATVSFRNFSERKREIAAELLHACRTAGFFFIVDHGLNPEEVSRMYGLVRETHTLPLEVHRAFKSSAAVDGNYAGWNSLELLTFFWTLADLWRFQDTLARTPR